MADKPIGPGDLVYVWKWHPCGCGLGVTGTVTFMQDIGLGSCHTKNCGKKYPDAPERVPGLRIGDETRGWNVPTEWVRRIPPQQELEGKKTQEPTVSDVFGEHAFR